MFDILLGKMFINVSLEHLPLRLRQAMDWTPRRLSPRQEINSTIIGMVFRKSVCLSLIETTCKVRVLSRKDSTEWLGIRDRMSMDGVDLFTISCM